MSRTPVHLAPDTRAASVETAPAWPGGQPHPMLHRPRHPAAWPLHRAPHARLACGARLMTAPATGRRPPASPPPAVPVGKAGHIAAGAWPTGKRPISSGPASGRDPRPAWRCPRRAPRPFGGSGSPPRSGRSVEQGRARRPLHGPPHRWHVRRRRARRPGSPTHRHAIPRRQHAPNPAGREPSAARTAHPQCRDRSAGRHPDRRRHRCSLALAGTAERVLG